MQIVLLINGISFLVEHFMKSVVGYKNKMQIEMIKNRNGGFRQKKKKKIWTLRRDDALWELPGKRSNGTNNKTYTSFEFDIVLDHILW